MWNCTPATEAAGYIAFVAGMVFWFLLMLSVSKRLK